MPRIFLAIEIPTDVKQSISQHIESIQRQERNAPVAWVPEENLHLTLRFLGEVDEKRIPSITEAASRSIIDQNQFEISIARSGCFPPRGLPRVLWLDVDDPRQLLSTLHSNVDRECARSGFFSDDKPFRPHLTIGRVRRPTGAREAGRLHSEKQFEPVKIRVEGVTVFQSRLTSAGARHNVLSYHPLDAP